MLLALTDAQRRYQIPAELFDQLAFGTLMDLPEEEVGMRIRTQTAGLTIQYRSFKDLYLYCYHVASVIGLFCIHIFGFKDPAAKQYAEYRGIAFQLTNILRDVKEDAGMGRIYLPQEDLRKFGVSEAAVRAYRTHRSSCSGWPV